MSNDPSTSLAPLPDGSSVAFEELVEHEVQRSPGGADTPVALVSPFATSAQKRAAHRLNRTDDGFAFALTVLGVLGSLLAGPAAGEASGSAVVAIATMGAAMGGSVGGFLAWSKHVARRKRAFDATNPRVRLVGPDWALTAHERFTSHAATLARLDVADPVRASLVETRRVMDDLLVAACDLHAAGLTDTPDAKRIYAQMRRHGAESAALLAVARQREAILDGRSVADVLAASSTRTMLDAASQMQDENAHLSTVLNGSAAAVGSLSN